MKKIYTLIGALAISTASIAQNNALYNFETGSNYIPFNPTHLSSPAKKNISNKTADTGPIKGRFDPMFNLFTNNANPGVLTTNTTPGSITQYSGSLFCDSLAMVKYSTGLKNITTHMAGITFDPQSLSQGAGFTSLFSKNDSFTIDTLWFGGRYERVSSPTIVDTLVIDVAWGDTTNTSVYTKFAYPSTSAVGKFGSLIAPKFSVVSAASHGLQAKLGAPATNYIRYKAPLNVVDTNIINNITGYYGYKLPSGLVIPAGSRVAICYTYKPGMTYTLGAIASGDATNPSTINGWTPIMYGQDPQPTSSAGYLDYFNDFDAGKNMGVAMYSKQRYGLMAAGYVQTTALYNQFVYGYQIDISLHGVSSVGVNELENNGSVLGQNAPNPFDGSSTVTYKLTKDANAVSFIVTDVMGRVVSSEKASSNIGTHTIKLGSYAAGVYYYTLNVDGKTSTKKMIAQ